LKRGYSSVTVSLKHDGTDGPDGTVKMASLPVPFPSVCDRRDSQTAAET